MSNLVFTPKWNASIDQVESGEEISGGEDGIANRAIRQVSENVFYLKETIESVNSPASKIIGTSEGNIPVYDAQGGITQGYGKLGPFSPKIAMKNISATYPTTATLTITHGLISTKIKAISILCTTSDGRIIPPHCSLVNSNYSFYSTKTGIVIMRNSSNDSILLNAAITILITYEI